MQLITTSANGDAAERLENHERSQAVRFLPATSRIIATPLAMLYRGDFVYTEQLSDLTICHDHLLGKPGELYPPFSQMTIFISRRYNRVYLSF
jgi:hypothetical protein